ncbi:MAG: hypothetical protein WBD86_01840 [Microgenomates group bacterium]
MNKRKRFIVTSIILSLGFVGIQFIENQLRFFTIGALGLLTIILFVWSLREGLGKDLTLLALVLPTFFTLGVGLFWFLLPTNVFARLPAVIFYGLGIYALCLTTNIYTVAAIRTIALLRAARGVGFVLTLVTSFLVFDTILSLKTSLPFTCLAVTVTSFPLFLQGYWTILLEVKFSKELFLMSAIASLIAGEMAASLFFWPVTVVVGSLFLTVTAYMLLGLGQAKLEARLFAQTVREYLFVGVLVFIGMFLATRWGG